MHSYSTPSDHRYPDSLANAAIPQATAFWPPGGPDGSQSAVTRNPEDRYGPPRLRANQLSSSPYASTAAFPIAQRDSYPAQSQSDCSGQYPYPQQQYMSNVNYAAPPFDFAEYPVSNDIPFRTADHSPRSHQIVPGGNYHGGQYATHVSSTTTRFEYPPSDPTPFQHTTYDSVGYFSVDGHYCSPLDGQHQQSLISDPSGYSRCDGSFDQFDGVAQHSIVSIPPSSSSSELGNALLEVRAPETQQVGRTSIALPSLPVSTQPAPKHESSENGAGLTTVKTEYGTTASGQSFSPMTPLDHSPSLTSDRVPYIKEEEQEQRHVGNSSMQRPSSPLHGHGSLRHRQHALDSFRLVQDPAAYPGFAPSKVRSYLAIAYSCSTKYRGIPRHRPYPFQVRSHIPPGRLSRRRSRPPIREHQHRV